MSSIVDNQKKLLIVDDTTANIDILVQILKPEGHKLFVASSGEKAIQLFPKIKPDLVLMDIMMSGLNGFDTCLEIKKIDGNVPIFFLTADQSDETRETAYRVGGFDFISKPFKAREVLLRIQSALSVGQKLTEADVKNELARQIQTAIKPNLNLPSWDAASISWSLEEMGGDYLDVLPVDDGLCIGIGDVTGHGFSAAILALSIYGATRAVINLSKRPEQILSVLDHLVYDYDKKKITPDRQATFSLLWLTATEDKDVMSLTVTGYHESIFLYKNETDELIEIETEDLGAILGTPGYAASLLAESRNFELRRNDFIVLYTDGIVESYKTSSENKRELFGIGRLRKCIEGNKRKSAQEIIKIVTEEIKRNEFTIADDLTIAVFRWKGCD